MDDFSDEDEDESQPLMITAEQKSYDSLGGILGEGIRRQHIKARLKIPHGEHTQAYEVLQMQGLLVTAFRKERFNDIFEDIDLTVSFQEMSLVFSNTTLKNCPFLFV